MKWLLCILVFISFLLISTEKPSSTIYQKDGIEVSLVPESNEFSAAKLLSFDWTQIGSEIRALFTVENYELKASSNNNLTGICANSKDGQHIHIIADNKPYTAIYQKDFTLKLDTGSHLILAFLSRSHHQSIKNKQAYQLKQIDVEKKTKTFDLKKTYLFYSRPKGIYVGNDTKEILLDFYLVNGSLSSKGNKVRVTLDGIHQFILTKWAPYLIKGLSIGDHTIKMTLIDTNNKEIASPILPVERTFSLQENPK